MEKDVCDICLEEIDDWGVTICAYSCKHWVCPYCYRKLRDYNYSLCPICSAVSMDPIKMRGGYTIFVRNIDGRTLNFSVSESKTTVEDLKYLLYCKTNISLVNQILTFNGRVLENNRLIYSYKIETGCTLQFMVRVRGD